MDQDVIQKYPGTDYALEALFRTGFIKEQQRQYEEAESFYRQVIEQYPNSPPYPQEALFRTAFIKEQQQQYEQAEAIYQQILQQCPNRPGYTPAVLYRAALIKECQQQYEQAENFYQQILQQYPNDTPTAPAALLRSGLIKEQQRQYGQAENLYQQIVQQHPNSPPYTVEALYRTALMKEHKQQYEQAESLYQQAAEECQKVIEQHPNDSDIAAPALHTLAVIRHLQGKYEEAKSLYQQVTQQYPASDRAPLAELGAQSCQIMLLVAEANDVAAQVGIDQLLATYSDNPELPAALLGAAGAYYHRGLAANRGGKQDFQKAVSLFKMVIERFSGSAVAAVACSLAGDCYEQQGEYQAAADYYQKVVDDYPGYELVWHCLFMVGRNYEAIKKSGATARIEVDAKIRAAYQQLVEKYPDCKPAGYARRWLAR